MNTGLVILAGWLQWVALVALLLVAILRDVADHHAERNVTYERRSRPDRDRRPEPGPRG